MSLSKKPTFNLKVVLLVQSLSLNPEEPNTGIQFLGDNIAAALQLVTNEMEWLKTSSSAGICSFAVNHPRIGPRILELRPLHSFTLAPHCVRCSAGVRENSWTVWAKGSQPQTPAELAYFMKTYSKAMGKHE